MRNVTSAVHCIVQAMASWRVSYNVMRCGAPAVAACCMRHTALRSTARCAARWLTYIACGVQGELKGASRVGCRVRLSMMYVVV